jgi:hypothetical protein
LTDRDGSVHLKWVNINLFRRKARATGGPCLNHSRVGDGMAVTAYEVRYRQSMFMLVVILVILGFASWAMILFI